MARFKPDQPQQDQDQVCEWSHTTYVVHTKIRSDVNALSPAICSIVFCYTTFHIDVLCGVLSVYKKSHERNLLYRGQWKQLVIIWFQVFDARLVANPFPHFPHWSVTLKACTPVLNTSVPCVQGCSIDVTTWFVICGFVTLTRREITQLAPN